MFSIPEELASGYVSAAMSLSEARAMQIAKGLCKKDDQIQNINEVKMTTDYLNETYPQQSASLMNLIMNSYHALEEKGGTLEILTDSDGESVDITVRDNGYGISKENMSHIFEPFFTTKEDGKGMGLGMAIVAQVVEEHSGKIQVDSEEGEGTSICVSIPVIR